METIEVARQGSKGIFDAGFWLDCEREAAQMLRIITGVDEQVERVTPAAGVAAP